MQNVVATQRLSASETAVSRTTNWAIDDGRPSAQLYPFTLFQTFAIITTAPGRSQPQSQPLCPVKLCTQYNLRILNLFQRQGNHTARKTWLFISNITISATVIIRCRNFINRNSLTKYISVIDSKRIPIDSVAYLTKREFGGNSEQNNYLRSVHWVRSAERRPERSYRPAPANIKSRGPARSQLAGTWKPSPSYPPSNCLKKYYVLRVEMR